MQRTTAGEIAELVGGDLHGDPARAVERILPLETATQDAVSFIATARYLPYLQATRAGVALVRGSWLGHVPPGCTAIVVDDPHTALYTLLSYAFPVKRPEPEVHPTAVVASSVRLGREVYVGPYVVIGEETEIGDGVSVGAHTVIGCRCLLADDVLIHPQVTLYDGVTVLERAIIHSGARLGADGFGYVWADGAHRKVPQVGGCVIQADVEIGANSTIDRGSIGDTIVGAGTKLDNLIQVGHNARIGRHVIAASQVGVAGSTIVEDGVVLGGQVGIGGHLRIGAAARIGAQAGVTGDVPAGATYSGYPARPHRDALRAQASIFRLPELLRRLKRLEARVFGSNSDEITSEKQESAPAE